MKVTITATLEDGEESDLALVLAALRDIGIERSPGDSDGRRWVQVRGKAKVEDLVKFVALLNSR